jgi:hypothetical protein
MPRLPAKQREAEKIATKLSNGSYAAAANDSPAQHSWEVRFEFNIDSDKPMFNLSSLLEFHLILSMHSYLYITSN